MRAKIMFIALQAIKDAGGSLPAKDVKAAVGSSNTLDDWAHEVYESTSDTRWNTVLQFYSVGFVKAGFLIKNQGFWYLTPEGDEALKLGELGLIEAVSKLYKQWKKTKPEPEFQSDSKEDDEIDVDALVILEEAKIRARDRIEKYIKSKNAYEFQDLVAALLRGMGYYTVFVAPKGKDGGIDVIAYRDPLGSAQPRIKAQVKHKDASANIDDVQRLMGVLKKDGEIGVFVSSSGFTSDAKTASRGGASHVELVDLARFIQLWQEFYSRLADDDKNLLSLEPVYFLKSEA